MTNASSPACTAALEMSLPQPPGFESFITTRPAARTVPKVLRRALNSLHGAGRRSSPKRPGKELPASALPSAPKPNHPFLGNASIHYQRESIWQIGSIELFWHLMSLPEPPILFWIRMAEHALLVSLALLQLFISGCVRVRTGSRHSYLWRLLFLSRPYPAKGPESPGKF